MNNSEMLVMLATAGDMTAHPNEYDGVCAAAVDEAGGPINSQDGPTEPRKWRLSGAVTPLSASHTGERGEESALVWKLVVRKVAAPAGPHRYNFSMAGLKLTHTSAIILQTISSGCVYGYTIMEATGLPSGTVYPALRRLERDGVIRSQWEKQSVAESEQRPQRKYYKLTRSGETVLEASQKRYPLLAKLVPTSEAGTS